MSRRDVGVRVTCALGGAVLCAVAGPVDAASVKSIVLVHGACFDGSGRNPGYEILVKGGDHASVVQEALTSLERRRRRNQARRCLSRVRASLRPTVTAARSRPRVGTDPRVVA
jgi:hypothetical protein